MEVINEKYVEINYDELKLKKKDLDKLCKLGLDLIKSDEKFLIEYAVNRLMRDVVEQLGPNLDSDINLEEKFDILREYIKIKT